jgi:hypothetical protein
VQILVIKVVVVVSGFVLNVHDSKGQQNEDHKEAPFIEMELPWLHGA